MITFYLKQGIDYKTIKINRVGQVAGVGRYVICLKNYTDRKYKVLTTVVTVRLPYT